MTKNEMINSYNSYQDLLQVLEDYCSGIGEEFDLLTIIDYEHNRFTVGLKIFPTKYTRSDYNELEINLNLLNKTLDN